MLLDHPLQKHPHLRYMTVYKTYHQNVGGIMFLQTQKGGDIGEGGGELAPHSNK